MKSPFHKAANCSWAFGSTQRRSSGATSSIDAHFGRRDSRRTGWRKHYKTAHSQRVIPAMAAIRRSPPPACMPQIPRPPTVWIMQSSGRLRIRLWFESGPRRVPKKNAGSSTALAPFAD